MALDNDLESIIEILKQFRSLIFENEKSKSKSVSEISVSNGPITFQAPIKGTWYNSGGFDPTGKGTAGRVHEGIDFRAQGGSAVYPIANGIVKYVRPDPKGGNTILISHTNGYTSYYAHLGTINVVPGDKVNTNSQIATVGASGNAKGFPHVHLQLWKNGNLIDPATVISVPAYTPFNSKKEKLWLPGAKAIADNWNLNDYLKSKRLA